MKVLSPKFDFNGGLAFKATSRPSVSEVMAIQLEAGDELQIPLDTHVGNPSLPLVAVGQRVLKFQPLARANGHVSVFQHAPSSGTILFVPQGEADPSPRITLQCDGEDEALQLVPMQVIDNTCQDTATRKKIYQRIASGGVVGMGGAAFPAHVKISEGLRTTIKTLIVNAVECEPLACSDQQLLGANPVEIANGIALVSNLLRAERTVLAISSQVDEAPLINACANNNFEIMRVPDRYPAGSEKQLIEMVTGTEVPTTGLPIHLGVVCFNLATIFALYQAVHNGRPLVSRIVTVNFAEQCFVADVPIGIAIKDLAKKLGIAIGDQMSATIGGMMMGRVVDDTRAPILKTTSVVSIALENIRAQQNEGQCIRCGECVSVCPARLQPQQLFDVAKLKDLDAVQELGIFDCIECGCCDYVCPSQIPLVDYFRTAKSQVNGLTNAARQRAVLADRYKKHVARLRKSSTPTERIATLAETADMTSEKIDSAIDEIKERLAKRKLTRKPPAE